MQVLVVDDDAMFREELAELLKGEGHRVHTAPSVQKAVEELEQQDFDVVLTDLKMPRHSGLELLTQVRQRWPRTLVVMITGFATVETAVAAMKAGAFDYVRKPFQIEQVRKVLELAGQELQFQAGGQDAPDIDSLARTWVRKKGLDVLMVTQRTPHPHPGITVFAADLANPSRIREVVDSFVLPREKAAVILERADQLIQGHRRQDIVDFLSDLRGKLEKKGPFVVTFDPKQITVGDLKEVRAAVVAPNTHATLEALANPLRRSVLRRVAQGPCSFTQAMQAVGLDDSPKLSFHLRRLVEEGLLTHQDEEYRITPKGSETAKLLAEIDELSTAFTDGNAVVPARL
ncbi:MAG: response regulator [Euryarchaeota archaeon]|nr:response regulator [Euryarchaeota archaeon]MDE1835369.1 response regulator [Euryarchaeota archaeon]MDE1880472.1 response regulator [Euryarchaeota archaeon]MDE2043665.1 response regulator [Thermoplasmata archaeon]